MLWKLDRNGRRSIDGVAAGFYGIATLVIIACLVAALIGWQRCDRQGKAYVRGLFWMECVAR